jgi:hypothetical protein
MLRLLKKTMVWKTLPFLYRFFTKFAQRGGKGPMVLPVLDTVLSFYHASIRWSFPGRAFGTTKASGGGGFNPAQARRTLFYKEIPLPAEAAGQSNRDQGI